MNEKSPVRIGLAGLGRAGCGMHGAELKDRIDKFVFYAACDVLPERAAMFRDRFGSKPYERFEDMITDPGVELVSIATRSCDHFAQAKAALRAGKDVFLEKPFCLDTAQAKELIALGSRPGGPRLYIRHNRRFERGFELVSGIIDSGILGEVYEIKLARNGYQRRRDWQTLKEFGGGQLLNWGPHIIDHSLCFCGGAYTSLYSELRHITWAGDTEDHVKIVFTGKNGRIVDMEISSGAAISAPAYTVYGSKGALVSEGQGFKLRYLDPEKPLSPLEPIAETPDLSSPFAHRETLPWIEERREIDFEGTGRIWDALYDAIRLGKEFPVTLEQSFAVIEVIEKVKRAAEAAAAR